MNALLPQPLRLGASLPQSPIRLLLRPLNRLPFLQSNTQQIAPLSAKAFARPRPRPRDPTQTQSRSQTQNPDKLVDSQSPSASDLSSSSSSNSKPSPTTSTSTSSSSSSSSSSPSSSQSPTDHRINNKLPLPPPSKTQAELASQLPYFVRRTVSQGLPVYRRWKSGNTRQVVLVKKVDGNRRRLVKDLIEGVGVDSDRIRINPTTQHIELQGDYLMKAKDWLLQKGF